MLMNNKHQIVTPPFIVDGVVLPPNIEETWSKGELARIGLIRVTPDEHVAMVFDREKREGKFKEPHGKGE